MVNDNEWAAVFHNTLKLLDLAHVFGSMNLTTDALVTAAANTINTRYIPDASKNN